MNPNALRMMLDMYDRELGPSDTPAQNPSMFVTGEAFRQQRASEMRNARAGRMNWALDRMRQGGDSPNFFADEPRNALAAYVQPERFNEQQPQMMQPQMQRPRGRIDNYFARLMGA